MARDEREEVPETNRPGRPMANPLYKASIAVRFLISPLFDKLMTQSMKAHGFYPSKKGDISDYLRWCVLQQLARDGLADKIHPEDNTVESLRERGLG